MMEKENSFDLKITEVLLDKFKLSRVALVEKLTDPEGPRDITNLLIVIDRLQAEQMAACINAVANLEAHICALQQAVGIADLEVPELDIKLQINDQN